MYVQNQQHLKFATGLAAPLVASLDTPKEAQTGKATNYTHSAPQPYSNFG